jgi:site-specific recombinase XerD
MQKILRLSFSKWDKPRGPHILRHTFAMDWVRNNANLKGLQWIMGWSSFAMTEVYTQQSENLLDEAYEDYEKSKENKDKYFGDMVNALKK